MPLLRLAPPAILRDDPWRTWDGTGPRPARGPVIVPRDRLADLAVRPLGVDLAPVDDPADLRPHLPDLALVRLHFAFPHDGRPHSQARLLRARLGFTGELRAAGALVLDLVPHLELAGFDSAELPALEEGDLAILARIRLPRIYAPEAGARSIWRARHAAGGGEAEP